MNQQVSQVLARFFATLEIVRRELKVLQYSNAQLSSYKIDSVWVESLDTDMQAAEKLEAFVSRFGRLQDTIGDKLIPRALTAVAEKPASMLDNLNRAERLGWIRNVEFWLTARELRNKLVHEYMLDEEQFAKDVNSAFQFCSMFEEVYSELFSLAEKQFGIKEDELLGYLKG